MNISTVSYNRNIMFKDQIEIKNEPINNASYFDFSGMDTSILPSDDFYRYACGKWLENTEIPDAESYWGSFANLDKQVNDNLMLIMKSLNPLNSHEEKLCKTLYDSAINFTKRNEVGIMPLQYSLNKIDQIDSLDTLLEVTAELMKVDAKVFASFDIYTHPFDNKKAIIHLDDGGIGLPDPEMYLKQKDTSANRHAEKREKYGHYINNLFHLAGLKIQDAPDKIMKIETELAKVFLAKEDRKDSEKVTNVMVVDGFWRQIFINWGIDPQLEVNVRNPNFLNRLDKLIEDEPLDNLKVYLKFHLLRALASSCGQDLYDLHFNFFRKELLGIKEQKPIDEGTTELVSDSLGHAVGKVYVQKHFSPIKKQKVQEMVIIVKEALLEKIRGLDWMQEPTKLKAIEKVQKMVVEIGYPDEDYWTNYGKLSLDVEKPFIDHAIAIKTFDFNNNIQKLQEPIDKKNWSRSPQIVNAFNYWGENKIVLPAGILDYPFFTSDDALSWGAFGMVLAHEIIHSFDDIGRKYDADGNQADWWQKEDSEAYEAHSNKIVEQFNNYAVTFDDGTSIQVNGKMTLGENIADLGGLTVSFSAMKTQGYETIDGFTPEQRFFFGFVQIWRMKFRDDFLKRLVNNDSHSAPEWRVNGTLSQMKEFKQAFNLPDDCRMVLPEHQRSRMWG